MAGVRPRADLLELGLGLGQPGAQVGDDVADRPVRIALVTGLEALVPAEHADETCDLVPAAPLVVDRGAYGWSRWSVGSSGEGVWGELAPRSSLERQPGVLPVEETARVTAHVSVVLGLQLLGINYWVALVAAPLAVGLVGIVVERLLLRRLYRLDPLYGLLLTFGLALIAEGSLHQVFGATGESYPVPAALAGGVNLGFMFLPLYRAWVIAASVVVCFSTWFVIERTRLGATLRAATENAPLLQAFGVNVPLLMSVTYGGGVALAALAGVLAAPVVLVNSHMGSSLVIVVFAVVVIGGMGSILGAIVSGLALGRVCRSLRWHAPGARRASLSPAPRRLRAHSGPSTRRPLRRQEETATPLRPSTRRRPDAAHCRVRPPRCQPRPGLRLCRRRHGVAAPGRQVPASRRQPVCGGAVLVASVRIMERSASGLEL